MDRAAKEAKKRFPDIKREDFEDEDEFFDCLADRNLRRLMWREGYRQAEKDLALTWEDMVLLRTLFDATDANQSMGALTVQPMTREYYEYLLQEFNEQRKK